MKASIIGLLIIFGGCASLEPSVWEREVEVYGFDFAPYTQQEFLFTPNTYQGDYESIGLVRVVLRPHVVRNIHTKKDGVNYRRTATGVGVWWTEVLNPDDVLRAAFESATNMGANALTQFEFDRVIEMNAQLEVEVMQITGFAIRRK